ncbi:MAG: DNA polymerase III subunit delta [Opitutales bacterium]|nr:DNA polymerase III subunit delta [Opitutales bacterium]
MSSTSFHCVIGDDDFLVRQRAQEIFEQFLEKFPDDLSREVIDGRADRVDDAERILREAKAAAGTLSLFGGGKLVWLNEINFLNMSKTGSAQGSKAALEECKPFLENLGESIVILSACPVHRSHGFIKWMQQASTFVDVAKNEKQDFAFRRLIEETAKEIKTSIDTGAIECLAAKIGSHPRLGVEEIKKMACYLGSENSPITEELVMEMVPDFGEGDFFEASEAFFSGDLEWAMQAMDTHFFQGKDARPLLSTLQNRNRLLIQLRVLVDGGELGPNDRLSKATLETLARKYAQHFGESSEKSTLNLFSQNPWFLGRLLPLVGKFSARRLIDLQSFLIQAFQDVLAQPKESHPQIFKNLALSAHAK